MCMLVKFKYDSSRNTKSWVYTGGCYKDHEPVDYDDAAPGDVKDFKDVQFEVRLDHRDFSASTGNSDDDDDDSTDDSSNNALDDSNNSTNTTANTTDSDP